MLFGNWKMNKLFHYHNYTWDKQNYQHHYQFLVIKDIVLLHLIYEVDNPCPYTGIRILTSFFDPTCLFGMSVEFKGYSWSFWLFSNYWRD
jgi:hypothetical protein